MGQVALVTRVSAGAGAWGQTDEGYTWGMDDGVGHVECKQAVFVMHCGGALATGVGVWGMPHQMTYTSLW